jgi:tetratricopeptide (TPR) repeat protein
MSVPNNFLARAEQAALKGQADLARQILLRALEVDPNNCQAWDQLSALLDDPEDQLTALENARALCPPGTAEFFRLEERLRKHQKSNPVLYENRFSEQREKLEESIRLAQRLAAADKTGEAETIIREVVEAHPDDERALLVFSEITASLKEKVWALAKVVAINPRNEEGWRRLELLRQVEKEPLKRGRFLEERGDFEQAVVIYRSVIALSRSALERVETERRIERIELHRESVRLQPVSANFNILRLTLGPVLLFLIMVFMQSGLNVLHTPLVAVLGAVSVTAGSLLVTIIGMRPAPPKWIEIVGQPGTGDEPEIRSGLRELGWALLLAPFTIFLIEASYRLGILQASMLANLR